MEAVRADRADHDRPHVLGGHRLHGGGARGTACRPPPRAAGQPARRTRRVGSRRTSPSASRRRRPGTAPRRRCLRPRARPAASRCSPRTRTSTRCRRRSARARPRPVPPSEAVFTMCASGALARSAGRNAATVFTMPSTFTESVYSQSPTRVLRERPDAREHARVGAQQVHAAGRATISSAAAASDSTDVTSTPIAERAPAARTRSPRRPPWALACWMSATATVIPSAPSAERDAAADPAAAARDDGHPSRSDRPSIALSLLPEIGIVPGAVERLHAPADTA